jgi:uncharacterized protein (DUF1501 family)
MKRRDFIKLSTGALVCGPVRLALAQAAGHPGPYYMLIEARGGWDPTSFCDPKGRGNGPNGDINNYEPADIGQIGNLSYAPPPDSFLPGGANFINGLYSPQDFFQAHFQRLTVINGINYGTNSHNVGRTASWTGTRAREYPSFGALVASELAADQPVPFVASTSGESARTLGVVPGTVLSSGNVNAIKEIARPHLTNINGSGRYHSGAADALIESAAGARRQRELSSQRLLRIQDALVKFDAARSVDNATLQGFVDNLDNVSQPNAYVASRGGNADRLFDQAQVAFSAFEAGAAAAAQLQVGGFDTHDDHDSRHYPRLVDYLAGVDNIIQDATNRGLADNLVIVMASDFARTNKYNNDNGKDHWSHTSMMVWAGPNFFTGNRVVGATDSNQVSRALDPATLTPQSGGVVLTPEYVHQALRDLAGIRQSPQVATQFPFVENVLPVFV